MIIPDTTRVFRNLDGNEISVTYRPLSHRIAMEVEYNSLGLVMGGVSGAFEHVAKLFEEIDFVPEDPKDTETEDPEKTEDPEHGDKPNTLVTIGSTVHVARAIDSVYKAISFDNLWWLGERILSGAIVQGIDTNARIEKLKDCNYFTDKLDEFVLAIFWGLDVSFPQTFTKARGLLSALGAKRPGKEATIQTSSESSSTPSTEGRRNSLQ